MDSGVAPGYRTSTACDRLHFVKSGGSFLDKKTKKMVAHGWVSVKSCKIGRNVVTLPESSVASTNLKSLTAHARLTSPPHTTSVTNTALGKLEHLLRHECCDVHILSTS